MEYTFKKHSISDVEKLWLEEAAKAENFDARVLKVKLHGKLPKGFDPNTIGRQLYYNGRITLIGLWHVDHKHSIFTVLGTIIRAIRDRIIANPGINQVTAAEIASAVKLAEDDVAHALYELALLGGFGSGAFGPGGERITTLHLAGSDGYDKFLEYEGTEDLLETLYKRLTPGANINEALTRITLGNGEGHTGEAIEMRPTKPDTA